MSYYHAVKQGITFDLNVQGEECMRTNDGHIFKVNTAGQLYILNQVSINSVVSRSAQEWHKRLSHANFQDLNKLPDHVDNMRIDKTKKMTGECEICIRGKMTKHISKTPDARGTHAFHSIHIDLNGPIVEPNESEFAYVFGAICDYSQFVTVYLMRMKSDSPDALLKYISDVSMYGKINKVRTDGGGEFNSAAFRQILLNKGIKHETSAPYSPEMLGHIERTWRTIFNAARCLLYDSGVPLVLWPYAVKYAVYTRNRVYQRRIKCTPLEKATNKRPNLAKVELFGAKCYRYIQNKTKLEPRAIVGVFVGYHESSPAKQIYDPETGAIHNVKDVKFLNEMFYKQNILETRITAENNENDRSGRESADSPIRPNRNNGIPDSDNDNTERVRDTQCLTQSPQPQLNEHYNLRQRNTVDYTDFNVNMHNIYSIDRDASQTIESNESITHSIFNIYLEQNMLSNYNFLSCSNINHSIINVPNTFKQAMQSPEREQWIKAMDGEMESLLSNHTYDLVHRPLNQEIVGGRWVFSIKNDPDNNLRFKARFVAKGYTQSKGVNFNDTYAPTARMTSMRVLINMAVQNGYLGHHCDVNNAYLHSEIDYEIYMEQPEGYVRDPSKVCRLNKSIYGLKQSAAMWHSTLITFMNSQNLEQSVMDPCVFIRKSKSNTLILLIWVDDCIIFASSLRIMNEFKRNFGQTFKIKDLGSLTWFLGIQFKIEKDVIRMNQKLYTQNIIKRFNEQNSTPRTLPCDPNIYEILEAKSDKLGSPTTYREIVGSLIYLMTCTRPDIAFIVTLLSRYMNSPTKTHINLARSVLRYLKYTLDYDLKYVKTEGELRLYGYSDSDWASDNDRQSVSGYAFKCNPLSGLVSWRSGKQTLVATSSCEAEYIALHEAVCEALFLRQIYAEFTKSHTQNVIIHADNQGCICLAKHPTYHRRTKHIDIRFHALRKYVSNKSVSIIYIPSRDNLADMCTKALRGTHLKSFSIIRGILPKKPNQR